MAREDNDDDRFEAQGEALLIRFETGDEHWIPKSQIHDDSEVYDADEHNTGKVVLPGWLARDKGLA